VKKIQNIFFVFIGFTVRRMCKVSTSFHTMETTNTHLFVANPQHINVSEK